MCAQNVIILCDIESERRMETLLYPISQFLEIRILRSCEFHIHEMMQTIVAEHICIYMFFPNDIERKQK